MSILRSSSLRTFQIPHRSSSIAAMSSVTNGATSQKVYYPVNNPPIGSLLPEVMRFIVSLQKRCRTHEYDIDIRPIGIRTRKNLCYSNL